MTARISFVNFNGKAIEGWLSRGSPDCQTILNSDFLKEYCPNTIQGIELLSDYLKSR